MKVFKRARVSDPKGLSRTARWHSPRCARSLFVSGAGAGARPPPAHQRRCGPGDFAADHDPCTHVLGERGWPGLAASSPPRPARMPSPRLLLPTLLAPTPQRLLRGCRSRVVSIVAPKWVGHDLLPAAPLAAGRPPRMGEWRARVNSTCRLPRGVANALSSF